MDRAPVPSAVSVCRCGSAPLLPYLACTALTGRVAASRPQPERRPDACRVHGSLVLNKVAGNFHITAGKAIGLPTGQHAHISAFLDGNYNFSHRIIRWAGGLGGPRPARKPLPHRNADFSPYGKPVMYLLGR